MYRDLCFVHTTATNALIEKVMWERNDAPKQVENGHLVCFKRLNEDAPFVGTSRCRGRGSGGRGEFVVLISFLTIFGREPATPTPATKASRTSGLPRVG